MEWISVKKQMPEDRQDCLVWSPSYNRFGKPLEAEYRKGKFLNFVISEHEVTGVTHWMPFPKPPCE